MYKKIIHEKETSNGRYYISAQCFCFPCKLFSIIELKLACFSIQLVTKHLRITFGKVFVVTKTWLDKKDHCFTSVGSCPRQKSSDFHLLFKFKRKVLTCLQTKVIVNKIVTTTQSCDELKKLMCNRRRNVAWQLSQIEMRYTCLEEVPFNILKKTAKYRLCFFTLWLGFYPSFMFDSYKTETVNRNRRLFPPSWSWPLGIHGIKSQDFSISPLK